MLTYAKRRPSRCPGVGCPSTCQRAGGAAILHVSFFFQCLVICRDFLRGACASKMWPPLADVVMEGDRCILKEYLACVRAGSGKHGGGRPVDVGRKEGGVRHASTVLVCVYSSVCVFFVTRLDRVVDARFRGGRRASYASPWMVLSPYCRSNSVKFPHPVSWIGG